MKESWHQIVEKVDNLRVFRKIARIWCKVVGHDWWQDYLGRECRRCFQCATLERSKYYGEPEWVNIPEKRTYPGTHHKEAKQVNKNE